MTVNNYIFDIDGTLIDTFAMYMPALVETLEDHGYHFPDPAKVERDLYGIAAVDALKKLGVPAEEIDTINEEWINRSYQHFDQVRVLPGIPATISQLAAKAGTKLAIVTSKTRAEYQRYFQDQYPFAENFAVVVTADDTTAHKPSPAPILKALDRLGADPTTAVYVGDMPTDLAAAHAAGIRFAGAEYGASDPEKIAAADLRLAQPRDLLTINQEGAVQL